MDKKLLKIEIGSHYFKILTNNSRVYQLLSKFCMKYSLKGFVNEKGRSIYKVIKIFGNRTKNEREYRFHIGQYKAFMRELEFASISDNLYDITYVKLYKPTKIKIPMNDGWVLRDYQTECRAFIVENDSDDLNTRLVTLPTGTGKQHSLSTPIKIPGGWTTMGDVTMDQEVITQDGSITNVDGIFPQGVKDNYRITFTDGRSTTCGPEHLWRVYGDSESPASDSKVLSLEEIIVRQQHFGDRFYIDIADSEQNEDTPELDDTYVFGLKLAMDDGEGKAVNIPKKYLSGSTKQRSELLRGYLDYRNEPNQGLIYILVQNSTLAKDLQYLVRSLAGICTMVVSSKIRHVEVVGEIIIGSKLVIELPIIPTKDKITGVLSNEKILRLGITDICFVGREESQCISVTHPSHLYVVEDFIVTHNTVTGLAAISDMNHKVLICVLPSYMDKWAKDVTQILNVKPKEIMLVRGSKELKGLIGAAVETKLPQKVYIISLRTISNYIKSYEEHNGEMKELGFDCVPDELCKVLDVGSILIDETHQHLHAVYKLISYSNVPKVVGLSATLISDDPMIKDMQYVIFPKEKRYDKIKMKKYIKVYSISYRFDDIKKSRIQTTERRSKNYSHNAFERSILQSKTLKRNYCKLIADLVRIGYDKSFKAGDKLIIFASSVAMCEAIVEHLQTVWPAYDTRRYVEADPYENAIDADIRITTIQSAGTALDIPGLRTAILTNSISSSVSNLQAMGRLRELKDRDVKFIYMYSEQIPKQMDYHRKKMDLIRDRVASIKQLASPLRV